GRPFAGAAPPAKFGAANDMVQPGRPVPWRIEVPLHVRVVSKQFPVPIERCVILIAKTDGDEFPGLALGIDPRDPAARAKHAFHKSVTIPHASQKMIFTPIQWN